MILQFKQRKRPYWRFILQMPLYMGPQVLEYRFAYSRPYRDLDMQLSGLLYFPFPLRRLNGKLD